MKFFAKLVTAAAVATITFASPAPAERRQTTADPCLPSNNVLSIDQIQALGGLVSLNLMCNSGQDCVALTSMLPALSGLFTDIENAANDLGIPVADIVPGTCQTA